MQRDEHQDGAKAQADRDGDGEGSIGSDGALSMAGQVAPACSPRGIRLSWRAYAYIVAVQQIIFDKTHFT